MSPGLHVGDQEEDVGEGPPLVGAPAGMLHGLARGKALEATAPPDGNGFPRKRLGGSLRVDRGLAWGQDGDCRRMEPRVVFNLSFPCCC